MPRTAKPAGTAVDRRNGRPHELHIAAERRLPAMPDGLIPQSQAMWQAYWDDPVSQLCTPIDEWIVVRWITESDRYLRLTAEGDREPLVTGSQGQLVENPAYKIAYRSLGHVEQCEKTLGIGPAHRASLGVTVLAQQKGLAEMNAKYGGVDDVESLSSVDPRVIEAAG